MQNSQVSRRGFLSTLAISAVSARTILAEPSPTAQNWKLGAQSYTWRKFSLEQALQRMQKLGLKYVEFATPHVPADTPPEQIDAVKRLCDNYGVKPFAAGVLPFSKNTDQNRKHFEFAKALGIGVLSADPAPDAFDSLDDLCEEYQVAIAIHPHGPGAKNLHRWYSAQIIMDAVKDHHPRIGSCLDTGHLIRCAQPPFNLKLDPTEQIEIMGKRNFAIHLKDHDNAKREDVIYGKGNLDVASVLKALRNVGFEGAISIEHEANPDEPTDDVRACIQVVQEAAQSIRE